jgi:hypothetical protein
VDAPRDFLAINNSAIRGLILANQAAFWESGTNFPYISW